MRVNTTGQLLTWLGNGGNGPEDDGDGDLAAGLVRCEAFSGAVVAQRQGALHNWRLLLPTHGNAGLSLAEQGRFFTGRASHTDLHTFDGQNIRYRITQFSQAEHQIQIYTAFMGRTSDTDLHSFHRKNIRYRFTQLSWAEHQIQTYTAFTGRTSYRFTQLSWAEHQIQTYTPFMGRTSDTDLHSFHGLNIRYRLTHLSWAEHQIQTCTTFTGGTLDSTSATLWVSLFCLTRSMSGFTLNNLFYFLFIISCLASS